MAGALGNASEDIQEQRTTPASIIATLINPEGAERAKLLGNQNRTDLVQGAAVRQLLNGQGAVASPGASYFQHRGADDPRATPSPDVPLYSNQDNLRLLQTAAPEAFNAAALQSIIAKAFPAPRAPVVVPEGGVLADPLTGTKIVVNPKNESAYKDGELKEIPVGNNTVTMRYSAGTKSWSPIEGAISPRWEPQRVPLMNPLDAQKTLDEINRGRTEDAQKKRADQAAFEGTDSAFQNVLDRVDTLISHPALGANTGVIGARTMNVSPSSVDFNNQLDTLKSQLVLQAMQQARAGSASGATGFGALSEKELGLLQDAIQKLNPASGSKNFLNDLNSIKTRVQGQQNALRNARYGAQGWSIQR